jgi:hypothetical protein
MNAIPKVNSMEAGRALHTRLPDADEFLGTAVDSGVWPTEHKVSAACFPGTPRKDRITFDKFGGNYTWTRPLDEEQKQVRRVELFAAEGVLPRSKTIAGWFRNSHRDAASALIQEAIENLSVPAKAMELLQRAKKVLATGVEVAA